MHNSKDIPGPLCRGRLCKGHGPPVRRVGKAQLLRPEGNVTAIVQETIFPVPYQRQVVVGKLAAYLMGAACDEFNTDKAQAIPADKAVIIQPSLLHPLGWGLGYIAFALGLVAVH